MSEVPKTCGECDYFAPYFGFGNVPVCEGNWPERKFDVSADSAPPSDCPFLRRKELERKLVEKANEPVSPKPWTKADLAAVRRFVDEVNRRAEANMLKTGKLEGSHYAAMRTVLAEMESAVR